MITTRAYIVKIPENGDNHFKVRVPFMEDNTGEEAVYDALLCVSPTSYNGYSVGDVVFVTFENNKYNNCIILGKMFTSTPTDSSAYTLTDELKVTGQAYLPPTTKIGEYTAQDLTNLYNAASNGGTGNLDEDELRKHLKEYVKWIPTERESAEGSVDFFADKLQVLSGSEFDDLVANSNLVENTLYCLTSVPATEFEPEI